MPNDVEAIQYVNDLFALTDEKLKNKQNCGNYKISVFLALKPMASEKMFNEVLWLQYPNDIIEIQLVDDLYSIGLRGYIDVKNTGSQIDAIMNKSNLFHVVINITEYNLDETPLVKYEPYIFDIGKVTAISNSNDENQILRIELIDIITSIFEQHSFASVIQYNTDIRTSTSYKQLFKYIFSYVKDHIKTNFNNTYELKKELLFDETFTFVNQKISGNDEGVDMMELIKDTFGKIKRDSTIQEALKIIYQDCCTTLKTPDKFSDVYQKIGDVLIPFFFKEEYPDPSFLYTSICSNLKNPKTDNPIYNQVYGGEAPLLLYRHMSMRDIYIPFILAFGNEENTGVFEDINPQKDTEKVTALNGVYSGMIYDMKYNCGGTHDAYKLWKNVIFLSCAQDSVGGDSVLIYFSWFYDFFTNVFLNQSIQTGVSRKLQSNVTPSFHALMAAHSIKHNDSKIDSYKKEFSNKIDEHNSFIYASKTTDTLNECMRVMGKNIASFVLANDSYEFTIMGNIRRRPNEIIRFGFDPLTGDGSIQSKTIGTDINFTNYTYMYVSRVVHKFIGNEYKNDIVAYKFADVFDFQD